MKYLKLFEGFKELEFINTSTYKGYVKNKFNPGNLDSLLDWRFRLKEMKDKSTDQFDISNYDKEIKAVDFILSKHF